MTKRKAKTTSKADLLRLQDDLLAYFQQGLQAAQTGLELPEADACRYCWGTRHWWQWKSSREYQAALVSGDLDDPDLSDRGGYGYRPSRGPNPDCPECDGRGHRDPLLSVLSNLPPDILLRLRSLRVTERGCSITTDSPEGAIIAGAGYSLRALALKKGEPEDNSLSAALREISRNGSASPIKGG